MTEGIDRIQTKEDFLIYIGELLEQTAKEPDELENDTTLRYLEVIQAYTKDMDGYFRNTNQPENPEPSWRLFALILTAALNYE